MEEVSGVTKNLWGEYSDSNSTTNNLQCQTKHRTSSVGGEARASKFRGVVCQPNGQWGAQIYANSKRIWLGTYKSAEEAAMTYDSAVMKLRDGMNRNFPWTNSTVHELRFQAQFSEETVVDMIKKGTYASNFSDYLRGQDQQGFCLAPLHDVPAATVIELFQKELTPSDVGKLNRIVIPKKFALKYFPNISHGKERDRGDVADVELLFFDRSRKSWNFRYCYWKSSQSFVFTRGWNSFAREKKLRAKDKVIFSSYECSGQKLFLLDVAYADRARDGPIVDGEALLQVKMEMNAEDEINGGMKVNKPSLSRKSFKLFGVEIITLDV